MVKSYIMIKEAVHRRIRPITIVNIMRYLMKKKPRLWGFRRTINWEFKSLYLALYKHIYGIGYNCLLNGVKTWYNIGPTTLFTNIKRTLLMVTGWIKSMIKRVGPSSWTIAARNLQLPGSVHDTVLWIDSCDFKLIGKRSLTTKHRDRSYKENGPAQTRVE